jgi:hypothetical protein
MVQPEHEFNYGEPDLFMKIYVAKKAEFQPLRSDKNRKY